MLAEGTGGSKAGSGLTQELELHRLGGKSQGSYEGALGFLGNSLAVPQKMSPGVTLWSNNSIPKYIRQRTENMGSSKYLYMNVHSSVIHNRPKVEKYQRSINR